MLPFHAACPTLPATARHPGLFLLALIVVHAAAALKHHLIDKDATLMRMLGKRAGSGLYDHKGWRRAKPDIGASLNCMHLFDARMSGFKACVMFCITCNCFRT